MVSYNVRANEELFDRWKGLGRRVESLKVIVQNDMTVTDEEYLDWCRVYKQVKNEFLKLGLDTEVYVKGSQRAENR